MINERGQPLSINILFKYQSLSYIIMSLILVPSGNFKFRYNNEELTTETRYDEDDNIVAQISETDKVYFDSNTMSKDYEVYILSDYSDDPVNIVRE